MDASDYWPFARECSIWNAAVAALQFWTADLNPQGSAMLLNRFTQPFSAAILPSTYETYQRKYYLVTS